MTKGSDNSGKGNKAIWIQIVYNKRMHVSVGMMWVWGGRVIPDEVTEIGLNLKSTW